LNFIGTLPPSIAMATQAAVHQRNLESAILFMQTEHAQTLKGLHEEIKNLQKKCSGIVY
jgi:coiled-coil domain-containing protein 92